MNRRKATSGSHRTTGSPRTLVIPDIHMRWAIVEKIIAALTGQFDQLVFLGDFFDRPPSERGKAVPREEAEALVAWLRSSLSNKDRLHLVGNHDLSYFVHRNETYCTGATAEMRRAVQEGMLPHHFGKFRAATQVGPWLLSHAGFQAKLVKGRDRNAATLVTAANEALKSLLAGITPFPKLFGCGWARWGDFRYGGVTWCDWNEEFAPVRGVHQVVGHTYEQCTARGSYLRCRGRKVFTESIKPEPAEAVMRTIGDNDSCNWCIDTGLEVVAILEEETIRFVRWRAQ